MTKRVNLDLLSEPLDDTKERAMTDVKDTERSPDGRGSKRRRAKIYAERITVSLRIIPDLHQRMMDLCDELQTPANTYVLGLIESDLKKRKR